MQIKYENWRGTFTENITKFAEDQLNGSYYETGELEALKNTARNNSRAIGRLLELLATKFNLTGAEVGKVLELYEDHKIVLIHGEND